jgi:phosphatidylglycerol:prolipoprotein diacylglycerol transferase
LKEKKGFFIFMYNDITIGPVTIHMYGLMIALGFMSALWMCSVRGKKQALSEDTIWGIFFCAILGGLVGTRLLYYIVELPSILKDPSILWNFKNGYVVYGGIIGGVLASMVYCRVKRKEAFLPYLDLVMPAVAMAQGFGRIGCFFAGCCYGRQTDAWYGITFTNSNFAPNGVSLIPTQLISSAGDFIICILLLCYARKKPVTGRVGAMYFMLYGIGRFLVEFLRNDYRGSVGALSTSQLISVAIVAAGAVLYFLPLGFKRNAPGVKRKMR